jgi:hypothetical protein
MNPDSTIRPGTLMHMAEGASHNEQLSDHAAMSHILQWMPILLKGGTAFGAAINKEGRKLTQRPLLFATMVGSSHYINIAHGINQIAMDDDTHGADGLVGFFVNDHLVLDKDGEISHQDPQYWASPDCDRLTEAYAGKAATVAECKKEGNHNKLLCTSKTARVVTPKLLPVPMEWWQFLLSKRQSPLAFYNWLRVETKSWTTPEGKEATQWALDWARTAGTLHPDEEDSSCVGISAGPIYMDAPMVRWA